MKWCAFCGAENRDGTTVCHECASEEFSTSAPASVTNAIKSEPPALAEASALCTVCVCENDPEAAFCTHCGAPIGMISTIGPFERVFAEGFAYRRAVDGPPRRIVLIGMWILFLPPILLLPVQFAGVPGAAFFVGVYICLAAFFGAILYRATKNYFKKSRMAEAGL